MTLFALGRYTFSPKITWFFLTILVAYMLSSLGFWQLHRAEEKQALLTQHEIMAHAQPIIISSQTISSLKKEQPIQATGTYDTQHIFFLDNQFYQHQIGYEVIEPVILSPHEPLLLVSRGWIKASQDRQQLPSIKYPQGSITIHGNTYFPSQSLFLLGNNWDKNAQQAWPKRIEKIDFSTIQKWLDKPVYPFVLRLSPNEPYGFIRDWPIVSMPPERHTAYAIQWFAMAITVCIIFLVLSVKKNHVSKK